MRTSLDGWPRTNNQVSYASGLNHQVEWQLWLSRTPESPKNRTKAWPKLNTSGRQNQRVTGPSSFPQRFQMNGSSIFLVDVQQPCSLCNKTCHLRIPPTARGPQRHRARIAEHLTRWTTFAEGTSCWER